jgi:hypothetical protein
MRSLLLMLCLIALPALAQTPIVKDADQVGQVVRGVHAYLGNDGQLQLSFDRTIVLADGREAKVKGNGWYVDEDDALKLTDVKPIDVALYGASYIGRRVHISGLHLFVLDISQGLFDLPGTHLPVSFQDLPREALRYPLEHCLSLGVGSACVFDVVGLISASRLGGVLLTNPVLMRRQDPDPKCPTGDTGLSITSGPSGDAEPAHLPPKGCPGNP